MKNVTKKTPQAHIYLSQEDRKIINQIIPKKYVTFSEFVRQKLRQELI